MNRHWAVIIGGSLCKMLPADGADVADRLQLFATQQTIAKISSIPGWYDFIKWKIKSMMHYDLDRFVTAQRRDFEKALAEVKGGKKRSHWIWYIFPQLRGLGHSANSSYYGLEGLEEAQMYLSHPVLGPRLIEISIALMTHTDRTAESIMGSPDDMKLHSCATLFSLVPGSDLVFSQILIRFFGGQKDAGTMSLLAAV